MENLEFENPVLTGKLFGFHNIHLKKISAALGMEINSRGTRVTLKGSDQNRRMAADLLKQLYEIVKQQTDLTPAMVDSAIGIIKKNKNIPLESIFSHTIFTTAKNRKIIPRNPSQLQYAHAIESNDIVFSIGPAGTGKTYLAVALAVDAFTRGAVSRIILTRPAVEAGENLGFLPGDLAEKINPYLRPLYDALHDMLDFEKVKSYIEQEMIEIAPLAFMRGRTLNNAFIILDEAQNTTSEQMKMFLTRMGSSSKVIVTGDITQIDLPRGKTSGLVEAKKILGQIPGVAFVTFSKEDVVRHPLVADIINAYEKKKMA